MKTLTKITLIALLWITAINSGTLGTLDTDIRLQMAHAWWTGTEEVQISPNYKLKVRGDIQAGVIGTGGKRYIAYEQGQSLLMLPGDWLGTQLHQWFPNIPSKTLRDLTVNFLIFIPLNVATVVACFWLLRLFDFEERIAGLASLAWLLGTTVLHYAQVHQHNNQVLLFVIIGYAAALAYVRSGRPRFALISGLALGGTMLIRITSLIHVLTVVLFLIGCIAYQNRDKLKVIKTAGLWIVGFIPFSLVGRIFDYHRYGSFLATGKSVEKKQLFTDPMWEGLPKLPDNYPLINEPYIGILGSLFSPEKSIFIYDPLLLPCLALGILLWKKLSPFMQWYLITGLLNLGLHLAAYSRFFFWHGDSAWGARYQVTSIHLLLIPLLGLFVERLLSARKLTTWLMQGILALAILVQIASVTMPMNLEIYQKQLGVPGTRFDFRLGQRFNNIICLVNGSFSQGCVDRNPAKKRYLEHLNHLFFLPFNFSQKAALNSRLTKFLQVLLIVWVLVIALAIGSTLRYLYWE
ncbi:MULTISPECIES: hypothetical protein [unclassified Coleofasciculus]|uniref:hypothetical protein n=1 Tax=unclassified Coleofasciculus TaxID=2692782 RepID=UPI001882DEA4|nr:MULTISPECIES: hypothetical protein [unclassified Coleofasciculus]MBE9125816.1 hypothetical protein [Coleofasciculus sp. LEGE 07081]MBE9148999.1 hypothetical protein [Coleofasciculus sp. LEGE 07092]